MEHVRDDDNDGICSIGDNFPIELFCCCCCCCWDEKTIDRMGRWTDWRGVEKCCVAVKVVTEDLLPNVLDIVVV